MSHEIAQFLAEAPSREEVIREQRKATIRVNPRSGRTTISVLCYICAANLVLASRGEAGYACKNCRTVDKVVARIIGTPLLIPNLFEEESNESDDGDVVEERWSLDPSVVEDNREMRVFITSTVNHAHKRPDVSLLDWTEWCHPSPVTSARAYLILLAEELPDLVNTHPELTDVTWIAKEATEMNVHAGQMTHQERNRPDLEGFE